MAEEMICICCPLGCRLTVDASDMSDIKVFGNSCPRGAVYGREEAVRPMRTVTASVRVDGGEIAMVSVKTSGTVPKKDIFAALDLIKGMTVSAPVKEGDVIIGNILGTGVDFIATKDVAKRGEK